MKATLLLLCDDNLFNSLDGVHAQSQRDGGRAIKHKPLAKQAKGGEADGGGGEASGETATPPVETTCSPPPPPVVPVVVLLIVVVEW